MRISDLNSTIIDRSNEVYNDLALKHGISSSAVAMDNQETQYERFREIYRLFDTLLTNSVLDVGCGNGEFLQFLLNMGWTGKYVGVDINDSLLDQARIRFPGFEFKKIDILNAKDSYRADYVIQSGIFNFDMGQTLEWVQEFVKMMYGRSDKAAIFNAISDHVETRYEGMFYLPVEKMFDYSVRNLSPKISINHHFLPFNYTMAIYRIDD